MELRTLGGNQWNWIQWQQEGAKEGAAHTARWASCCASDLLVMGLGDTLDTLVLDKCLMPSLHLLLSLNTLLKFLNTWWPALKEVLYQVNLE